MTSGLPPLPLRGARALVLAFDPELPLAPLDEAAGALIAADVPLAGAEGAARLPLHDLLRPGVTPALRAFAPTVAVVHTLRRARPGPILGAIRAGVRRFLLVELPGTCFEVDAPRALALATSRRGRRALARLPGAARLERLLGEHLDPPWPGLESSARAARAIVDRALAEPQASLAPPAVGPLRVVHYLGTLGPGGAERQLSYLAAASQAQGHRVAVWAADSLEGASGHYAPGLRARGVEVARVRPWRRTQLTARALATLPLPAAARRDLAEHAVAERILPLAARLREERPDVLHCWLDETNLQGALAGLLADVPRVLVSARNLSPARLPRLLRPWLRAAYRELARSPRVVCLANSSAGAADYAEWTGTPRERWRLVLNGFDLAACAPRSPAERAAARAAHGVGPDDLLVVGVFRLDAEKRPRDFLRVLQALRARVPRLRALHVGDGAIEAEVRAEAAALGLGETLAFLGRRADPWSILGAADAALLTSDAEGLPNVALESQALEVPIVLTNAGGAAEAIAPGESGFLCAPGDVEGLAARLEELAADPALRARMGSAGRRLVEERFGLGRMVEETLALYR